MTEREDSYIAGTKAGGLAAAKTNRQRYGKSFYKDLGAKGGAASAGKNGFGNGEQGKELARIAGRKGGQISKRTKKVSS